MTITPFEALACPIDGSALQLNGSSRQCSAGHSFDIARQGYVHLLPVQNKRSKDPGDNKEMVAARQRFLAAGFYEPIAEAVYRAVFHENYSDAAIACMDAGCGEGYYMRYLAGKMPDTARLALLGLDISKWAILSAAKQDKAPEWVVGSNANLPVLPETLDCILCLFGFPVYKEFARVLRPGGEIVQVDSGPDHLIELREIIYSELKEPRQSPSDAPEGFTMVDTSAVRFNLSLPGKQAISDLLAMTPHLYRAGAEGLARAAELESLTVTVEATVKRFKKS
ncbi:putative RNA methyltransferase [Marinobacter sp. KMM 10035]|uniref:putative RNA methyltransferase n=1 Tax=Marinobacter sp. KMM 10035 TaxID=3134034 RepID=UPI00397AEEC6